MAKTNGMTREEAKALYENLHQSMTNWMAAKSKGGASKQKVDPKKIAEAIKMPTFATRFNSMSSAVGPLIIDNLITEQKMQKLSLESNIVDTELNPIDMSNIFFSHPILNQFQRTIGIARPDSTRVDSRYLADVEVS